MDKGVDNYSFERIVGHESIIDHLQNALRMKKVSHAYILAGEDGSGKNQIANAFASALQCEAGGVNPCGRCQSCIQFKNSNQPDIIRVTHEKASLSVEDIRAQLNQDIQIKPYSSRYKVYIIDEAEKMTEQAQNALLKTLEEPPEYAVIMLLTNNLNIFLPTIRSRCVILDLKMLDKDSIKEYLMERIGIPDYQAELAAAFSAGNIGKAIQYASSDDFIGLKDNVVHLVKYMDEMKVNEMVAAVKAVSSERGNVNAFLDLLLLWFRDVLMFKATKNINGLLYRSEIESISQQTNIISFEGVENIINAIHKARERVKANVNLETLLELLMLTIKDNFGEDY